MPGVLTRVLRSLALTLGLFACKLSSTDCYTVSEFGYISMNPRLNEAVRPYGEEARSQTRERRESPAGDAVTKEPDPVHVYGANRVPNAPVGPKVGSLLNTKA